MTQPTHSANETHYLVEVWFEIEKDAEGYPKSRDFEALLCQPIVPGSSTCVVKSVPFYLRNVAYGDTIRIEDGPDNKTLSFHSVVNRGGYSVYRVYLHDPARRDELVAKLLPMGALIEQEKKLIAIAVPPGNKFDETVDYICAGKDNDWWGAQDGFIFEDEKAEPI